MLVVYLVAQFLMNFLFLCSRCMSDVPRRKLSVNKSCEESSNSLKWNDSIATKVLICTSKILTTVLTTNVYEKNSLRSEPLQVQRLVANIWVFSNFQLTSRRDIFYDMVYKPPWNSGLWWEIVRHLRKKVT